MELRWSHGVFQVEPYIQSKKPRSFREENPLGCVKQNYSIIYSGNLGFNYLFSASIDFMGFTPVFPSNLIYWPI